MAKMDRRGFVQKSALAAASVTIVPRSVLGGRGFTAPSDKLNIAGVGIGGQGGSDLHEMQDESIVALCDVDWDYASETLKRFPKAARYHDFRVMLEKEKGIDAVVVGTPDHTHAIVSMAAIRAGKHVYCEKPLTHTIHEARAVTEAAREAGVATQMGNQGMAFEGNRQIKEWLADGAIGPVREVHVWSDRPTRQGSTQLWWAQGIETPTDRPPVPESLKWDLWLGPAAERPYHPAFSHFVWRGWWDFGEGGLGDMGVHNIAPAFDALKLTAPTSVHGSSTPVFPGTLPVASTVHYEFPEREGMPALKLHWYDGGIRAPRPDSLEEEVPLSKEDGLILVGDKGVMMVEGWGGHEPRLIPKSRMDAYQQPPKTLPRSVGGHYQEWIRACKEGTPTASNFAFAGPLTESLLLGTISIRLGGRKLHWDARKMQVTNCPEANEFIHYEYRQGWQL